MRDRVTEAVPALVAAAVAAPSMHNAQPWRFVHRTDTGVLSLYGDPDRALPVGDPEHRGMHLGCGGALFNLRVAAAQQGWDVVTEMFPDRRDPWRLADVTLEEPGTVPDVETRAAGSLDRGLADLFPAVETRHTNRSPFSDEQIPPEILDELCAAALLEGARLAVPSDWHADDLVDLVHDAELHEAASDLMRAEIIAWTRTGRAGEGPEAEGVPSYAFGPRQHDVKVPVRDFGLPRDRQRRATATFEERPQLAVLGTETDDPADWLRAGQAMERILLVATRDGLATSMMSQPLEWPELRSMARDPASRMGFVHMVFRLGYGPPALATPRRPVADVLTVV
ncbi:Acg family FMN-binding oxidoreductase [Streptomyces anulatus]|uniref:Acg family FMN-binding oxidoreductase n=1 Tax=Streptomyces anulatus TaxID=1892 RepID=UPI00371B9D19